eukprot:67106-Lingulodinium_polyedra.AAC.1
MVWGSESVERLCLLRHMQVLGGAGKQVANHRGIVGGQCRRVGQTSKPLACSQEGMQLEASGHDMWFCAHGAATGKM